MDVTIRPGHELLRCPVCRGELAPVGGGLVCSHRHSFDVAREGYVNLLRGGRRPPAGGGDSMEQLRRRAAFLAAGHFDGVASLIAERLRGAEPDTGTSQVIDAGCGTGHYLARIAAALGGNVTGLGLDISKDAARLASRQWPDLAFAVADLWREWPVRDAVADLVTNIFAPKNFTETARVLRPGGWLAVAYPGPDHLIELRRRFGLIGQQDDKADSYGDAMQRTIAPPIAADFRHSARFDAETVRDVVMMGPNARHTAVIGAEEPATVTLHIEVLMAQKPI